MGWCFAQAEAPVLLLDNDIQHCSVVDGMSQDWSNQIAFSSNCDSAKAHPQGCQGYQVAR